MSKFTGGIFSKSRGKLSGIVFSAARAREGKLMTAREFVIPANPQTSPQQNNRMIFDFVQRMVRIVGPGIYKTVYNRTVQDLPGYQSLLSLVRRAFFESSPGFWQALLAVPDILAGTLHFSNSVSINFTGGSASWSTENGANGSPSDVVTIIIWNGAYDTVDPPQDVAQVTVQTAIRSDGSMPVDTSEPGFTGQLMAHVYFQNDTNKSPENLSIVRVIQGSL